MKFGHALIIELLRHYGEDISALNGNLLYVAVCGEETNSEGMLTAAPFLNKLAAERNLHYRALLLSECYLNDNMAHDPTRYIHYGATGKVMPLFFCAGKGCNICKGTGWIEMLGSGVVHPNVLKNCGIDPEVYSGYAFGMGVERLAMMMMNINDIRTFYENDLRILNQF